MARNVLLLHGSAGGYGADRQLLVIATGLDAARYRPVVVLPERGELGAQLEEAGVELHLAPVAVLKRSLLRGRGVAATAASVRRSCRELVELAFDRKAALLHTNSSIVLGGQRAARQAGIPHLLHVREIYRSAGGRAGDALWPILRWRLQRPDALACASELVAEQLGAIEQSFVLHDALPRELELPPKAAAREALGIGDDRFVVAVIGRISDWKGQDVLARALAEPALAAIGAVGLVAGDAAPGQEHFERRLEELRGRLGLGDRLRLLGFRGDVETLLAAADSALVTSTHPEAFPNAALEGALAGLPVVATNNGGQRELVRDGVTGRLVSPGDHAALASALRELADDPESARRIGAAAAADVRSRFGADRMLEELQERYDRLLGAARPTAWLLPGKTLPVSHPAAPQVRIARLESWLRELGYEPVVFPFRGTGIRLLLLALRKPPRLVLTNAAAYAPVIRALKGICGRRLVAVADVMGLHSLEVDQAPHAGWARPLLRRAWRALEGLMCRSADAVLAVNDCHAAIVRRRYRPAGVHTLRDGAEPDLHVLPAADRATLGVGEDAVAVGFSGSLVYSRLDAVFAAWAELDGHDPPLCLVVVGDGPDLARYRGRARDAGWLGRSVLFLGALPRPDALAVLRACDVAYSDCWSDAGFPFKLYEYMALGLPIVTEGKEQTSEVLEEGRDALFFRTPAELAGLIRRLASDPGLRARLGAAARETFLTAHTLEHRRLEFAALLNGGPAPRSAGTRSRPRLASVVVPVLNEEAHIAEQLEALAAQTYEGDWELVVVDNGCGDRSIEIAESWRDRVPRLIVADARARRGLNHARNRGADAASGELLCYCDADDVVTPGWLEALVEAATKADLVGGALDRETLNDPLLLAWRPSRPRVDLLVHLGFLPFAVGGNCAVWTDVAREIRWDESFRYASSDIEFSWRVHLASYRLAYAPSAIVKRRHGTTLSSLVRQHYAFGRSAPQLYRRFRACGLRREGWRVAARGWRDLVRSAPDLVSSPERRGRWLRLAAIRCGRVVGSVRWRVRFL